MSNELSGVRADQKYSYRDLERVAKIVREQLNYDPFQAVDPLMLFEDLDKINIKLGSGVVIPLRGGVIALQDSEGYTRYDRRKKVIEMLASELTYSRLEEGHPRAGYFVAHELGHCVLHTDQLLRLARLPKEQQTAFHRGRTGHKPYEDTEWQANAFAGAFLMPAGAIQKVESSRGRLKPDVLAERFGVSEEAAGYRLGLYRKRRNELLI